MKSITVAILAYKEAENLKVLLPAIIEKLKLIGAEYEIEVIDTAKPLDNTEEVCNKFGAIYRNQEYPGFGGAFKTAIQYASKDLFLILDGDGSHNPEYIPSIYEKYNRENCDLVIGSRYVKGGKTFDSPSSIIMSKMLNLAFRLCLGIKAKDISTDYRLYDTAQLKRVELENVNYDVLQEVILKLKLNKKDFKIGEVPITFEKRMFGESKRQLIPFIISYIKSLFRLTMIRFSWLRSMILYGAIGCVGAVIDYLMFFIALQCGAIPEVSNIVGAVAGFLFTFTINSKFNFKKTDQLMKRFLSYGMICAGGTILSTVIVSLLKDRWNLYLLKLAVMSLVVVVQFVLNKLITYRE